MGVRGAVRRIGSVTAAELRDLVEAQAALLVAALEIRLKRRGTVIGIERGTPLPVAGDARLTPAVWRAAWAVDRAARYGLTRPLCLTRAVALRGMLRRRGMTGADVRVGVVRRDGEFQAHAWVECGDLVFDSAPGAAQSFVPLDAVRVRT
jgi:hypothetical protein